MKYGKAVLSKMAERGFAASGTQSNRSPADFFAARRIDARPECARHELSPKANHQRRALRSKTLFEQLQFVF